MLGELTEHLCAALRLPRLVRILGCHVIDHGGQNLSKMLKNKRGKRERV